MTDDQRAALRRARGATSLRAFAELLTANGLPDQISRQRLSQVEQGQADLTAAQWNALADALLRAGFPVADSTGLRPVEPIIEPLPPATPAVRRRQWSRVVDRLPGNRWWRRPNSLMERVAGRERAHLYQQLQQRYGIDQEWQRAETSRRLALGAGTGPFTAHPDDAIALGESFLAVTVQRVDLFVLRARLHNTGSVPWRDRLLYRLGPPVSSSLPFSPPMLPVPDTDPGDTCDIVIPGRAQWFLNLAVISYVMVFPDCSASLPGRLHGSVDTREPGTFDHTLPLPAGWTSTGNG